MSAKTPTHGKKSTRAAVDWREVERRLETARAAIAHVWTPSPVETARILKDRAREIAHDSGQAGPAGERIEVVEFLLAQERYAVESSYVREVQPLESLTPLPSTPPFVLGIVNLRGEILSVLDIKKFFGLPERGLTDLNKVIVLHTGKMCFGILADVVFGVRYVAVSEIQSSLPTLTGIREQYLKGVTTERLIVLDAEKILNDDKMVIQEHVE